MPSTIVGAVPAYQLANGAAVPWIGLDLTNQTGSDCRGLILEAWKDGYVHFVVEEV